ncbi:hypothetical protein AAZX31_14G149800 [Glycine max]
MARCKRIQEDVKEMEDYFLKATDDVLTETDQAHRKVEVPINVNLVASKESEKEVQTPPQVSVLFSQRLKDKSKDGQFVRFIEMLKGVHINILFAEAIAQMKKYTEYLKYIFQIKDSRQTLLQLVSTKNTQL